MNINTTLKYIKSLRLTISSLFVLCLCACSGPNNAPDVSHINIDVKTYRFDIDFYAIDPAHKADGLKKLAEKYPDFLNYYLDTILAYGINGNYNDTVQGIKGALDTFLTYKDFRGLQDTIRKHYPDSKETDEAFKKGFTYLKYYFPEAKIPKIIYLNMGLSKWPSFPLDEATLCIGLDMFLGPQFPYYSSIGIPGYMLTHTEQEFMPVSAFSSLYRALYPLNTDDRTLLDIMIQKGKEQYYLSKILPWLNESTRFGFTPKQIEWCSKNEALIYNFFIQNNLLYSKERSAIIPFVTDGPFAKGLESSTSAERNSPGNIGAWLGYRIVNAYMDLHKEIALKELLIQNTDPGKFLNEARYKPK